MLFGRMYPSTAAGLGAIRGLTFCGRNDMVVLVSWHRPFAEPTELPEGKKLFTLRDAALYITKLPKPSTMPQSGRRLWRRSCWLSNVMGQPCSRELVLCGRSTGTSSACSTPTGKTRIGDVGSWRGIDETDHPGVRLIHRALHECRPLRYHAHVRVSLRVACGDRIHVHDDRPRLPLPRC